MSRRDNLHLSLRKTLEKDGWTITDDPFFQLAVNRNKINLLVYEPVKEVIVEFGV